MIRKFIKKWSLLAKFLSVLILIMAVPLVLLGITSYVHSSYLLEEQGKEMANRISSEINNDIDTIIKDYDFILTRMLIEPKVQAFLKTAPDDYLKRVDFMKWFESNITTDFFLKNPYALDLRIVGANGIRYSTAGTEERAAYEHYEQILPESGGLVTFQTIEKTGRKPVISLCRRVFSGTECIGIVVLNIKGGELNRIWENVDVKGADISIFDQNKKLLYRSKERENQLELDALEENKDKILYAVSKSDITGWSTLVCMDKEVVLQPLKGFLAFLMVVVLLLVLFSCETGYFFIRLILGPLNQMKNKMKNIGNGEWIGFTNIDAEDEIGELMRGYNRMIEEIQSLMKQIQENEKEKYEAKLIQKEAEIQALQSQINPHFLYNTFGTINAYAMAEQKSQVQCIVDRLSKMFRYATCSPMQAVKVSDELSHVRDYLDIQELRLLKQIDIIWDIEEKFLEYPMLRLTLQPLVENVFKHGFKRGVQKDSRIIIRAWIRENEFILSVKDNGMGPEREYENERICSSEKESIGLVNVNRRMMIIFGEPYGVYLSGKPGQGAECSLVMPVPGKETE